MGMGWDWGLAALGRVETCECAVQHGRGCWWWCVEGGRRERDEEGDGLEPRRTGDLGLGLRLRLDLDLDLGWTGARTWDLDLGVSAGVRWEVVRQSGT